MPEDKQKSASQWKVQVAGADVDPGTLGNAMVEDSTHLPDMCTLTFQDQDHTVIDKGKFEIGKELKVVVSDEKNSAGTPLFNGEITALEAAFENGKSYTIVRGFDKAHRLYRGRRTEVYKDETYSSIVSKVAKKAGLAAGQIDPTGTAKPYVAQLNQSDAEFLKMLAGECGFILTVQDGKVSFKKPTASDDAPAPADFGAQGPLALVPGQDVLRYSAIISADSQVASVEVRSWDITKNELVLGKAPADTKFAKVDGVTPAGLAAKFGSPVFPAVDVPYADTTEANDVAKALADQIASAHAQLEGVARGNTELRAGKAVSLGSAGKPFDGKYTLTSTRHIYDNGEYMTQFFSTGAGEKTLQTLTSAGSGGGSGPAFVSAPIQGVVTGIVCDVDEKTNNKKDIGAYRVKVKIEQFGTNFETDWMQVAQAGVGPGRGTLMLPETGDQVVVAFDRGDIRRGYVLGGIYNGAQKPDGGASKDAVVGGKVVRRSFVSRAGTYMLMDDTDGKESVSFATKGDKLMMGLITDNKGGTIKVHSSGKIEIDSTSDITLKGSAKVTLESSSDMVIKSGGKLSLEAASDVSVKGINVKAEASANADIKGGAQVNVKGALATLEASGVTTVKGSLVKIN